MNPLLTLLLLACVVTSSLAAVLFLCSDETRFITGSAYPIGGTLTLR